IGGSFWRGERLSSHSLYLDGALLVFVQRPAIPATNKLRPKFCISPICLIADVFCIRRYPPSSRHLFCWWMNTPIVDPAQQRIIVRRMFPENCGCPDRERNVAWLRGACGLGSGDDLA